MATTTRNTLNMSGKINVPAMRTKITSILREAGNARNFNEAVAPLAVAAANLAKVFDEMFPKEAEVKADDAAAK